jgi:hypothetical protein
MKPFTILASLGMAVACMAFCMAAAGQKTNPEPKSIELSGRLHRPIKWTTQLIIVPAGQVPKIDLKGKLLRDIKEGTPVRIRGIVRTRLHRGGTKSNPSPFPPQWIVWLEVTEVEVLKDVYDVLK